MEEDARWTCEACGCNTNASTDTSCGICGTSQSGPSLLRRGYAARAAWLARGASRIAGINNNGNGGPGMPDMDEDDLWESVVHGMGEDIMEDRGRFVETARQRFMEAARALAHRNGNSSSIGASSSSVAQPASTTDPQTLWQQALETEYHPHWTEARQNGIEVGIGEEHRHLAHVPPGSGEGRAIRAEEPLPRNTVAGFRVVFENPAIEKTGANMGGCYLVGVTTAAFSAWHEHKGLQNSMLFWGIEDGGQIYEMKDRREADSSITNENSVTFGVRDVVTCILDGRTLTFWRGDALLGTIVNSLPRASSLYPVVVPFNSDVTVAIGGMKFDPLPLVQSFAMDWKKVQQERDEKARNELLQQRALIIDKDGNPTNRLRDVFKEIYESYMPNYERFWYCCGFKMKKLQEVKSNKSVLEFDDFFNLISRLVAEDVTMIPETSREVSYSMYPNNLSVSFGIKFKAGDKVELTVGYEKFGDASGGPLLPGDRGVVVDLQRAPNGEQYVHSDNMKSWLSFVPFRRSARVLYNGRRWWYQPQAIVSERSGLIDSPCVWFLRKILRSHGYDHVTLDKIAGEPLTTTSWRVGDIVTPVGDKGSIGRITSGCKDASTVMVEFCDSSFASEVGIRSGGGLLEPQKVEITKLVHWTFLENWKVTRSAKIRDLDDSSIRKNERVRSDVASLGRFERLDMYSLIKECKKSSDTLANLFANGLPDAILSALDVAENRMNSLEPPEDLSERVSSVGDLLTSIADLLYGEPASKVQVPPSSTRVDPPLNTDSGDQSLARRQRVNSSSSSNRSRVLLNVRRRADGSQDRRSMLANLVSRAGRRDLPINDDRSSLVFGAPSDFFEAWDGAMGSDTSDLPSPPTTDEGGRSFTEGPALLDSFMRCHNKEKNASGTAAQASFIRQVILFALCSDNVEWAKSLVDVYTKRTQVRQASVLRSVVDEENTPILLLALNLRCSAELIGRLVDWGAAVTSAEIELAAEMNQPLSLSYLLQRFSLNDMMPLDLSIFSDEVQCAFAQAKARQTELEKAMKDRAGEFMVKVLHRLFHLGLTTRRLNSAPLDSCARVICEILVGNVLLSAVREAQKDDEKKTERLFPEEESELGVAMSPFGLLRLLPVDILEEGLFKGKGNPSMFLMLCEDYLCSKDMADIAIGLTILSVILEKFPTFQSASEINRFGMKEFVRHHNTLASNRISTILSRRLSDGVAVSESSDPSKNVQGVVLCPKKHRASLHITRHSSFRCDLCGVGVERGRPMHGCRQCDWDACEDCTDRFETGLVKCTALQNLSSHCLSLLETGGESETEHDDGELWSIISRLTERDEKALADLACLLNKSNGELVSVHQFISIVLPGLHDAVVQDHAEKNFKGRRVKKAKVTTASGPDHNVRKTRFDFLSAALQHLVEQNEAGESSKSNVGVANTMTSMNDDTRESGKFGLKPNLSFCPGASEILRRLHQVLSFRENTEECAPPGVASKSAKSDDLQSLKKPIVVHLTSHGSPNDEQISGSFFVHAEPLISVAALQDQILRSHRLRTEEYSEFCRRLSNEHAVILEQPRSGTTVWKIAKVMSYNEETGAHLVRYASAWKRGMERSRLELDHESTNDPSLFRFTGMSANLSLISRRYYIIFRSPSKEPSKTDKTVSEFELESESTDEKTKEILSAMGSRVESCIMEDSKWDVFTLAGAKFYPNRKQQREIRFTLISDDGEVHEDVAQDQIRVDAVGISAGRSGSTRSRSTFRSAREDSSSNGFFPFLVSRQRDEGTGEEPSLSIVHPKALKRSWSALSLVDELQPIDLQSSEPGRTVTRCLTSRDSRRMKCVMDDGEFEIIARVFRLEEPPKVKVLLGVDERMPPSQPSGDPSETTLVHALKEYYKKQDKWNEWPPFPSCQLYFTIEVEPVGQKVGLSGDVDMELEDLVGEIAESTSGRSRKLSSRSLATDEEEPNSLLSKEFDSCCVHCMEIISAIAECAQAPTSSLTPVKGGPKLLGFSNITLSNKLVEQLENPVYVVGGALPEWCKIATSFAPHLFSYESRRALLERTAFGVSRGVFKQQEAKVNVGRLRQRMASLRARAVELVGEAFSGGAEDPTALQLQADELYGMEETLAMKVRAAFRAQNWSEHSLQVAKAVVRRDNLLFDAKEVLRKYAEDDNVRMRRLEVRFEGESGFDAASGDEAGVTRGFYADVAEALLSTEIVAGINCAAGCHPAAASLPLQNNESKSAESNERLSLKLPLWIPDMDSSFQVVLPSPRSAKESSLGVFPRPLPHYHPQHKEVKEMYRFMGRLFAASLRDGFMFPLQLSASFLKLVQHLHCNTENVHPENKGVLAGDGLMLLSSEDLPRPGFLGGEIRAAEAHICNALDDLEKSKPPLSRVQLMKRFEEIASDKSFGRVALGKSFDCSFNDYFQDRTFVDPFDPSQGQDAVPLCPKGASKQVTVFNIREWVSLAKRFVLHDGVVMQAEAFREGIEDFFPVQYLRVFTASELQKDVCGSGDQVDMWDEAAIRKIFKLDGGKGATEALVAVAAIGGEGGAALSRRFGPSSPTIGYLIKALLSASPLQRRQFLSFVTSVPIVTPGRIEVVPILSPSGDFMPMDDPSCLPRANTCSRRLYLPKFDSYESFEQVIWAVVCAENKFKGFWEWSGSSS